MLQELNKTVSTFRSDLLMGRYHQAIVHFQHLNRLLPILQSLQISSLSLQSIKAHIMEEMQIAKQISLLFEEEKPSSSALMESPSRLKRQSSEKDIGKWGPKSGRWKKKINLYQEENKTTDEKFQPFEARTQEIGQMDSEAIERQIILPLTLPDLFKNKSPSRIVTCSPSQTQQVIRMFSQSLLMKLVKVESVDELYQEQKIQTEEIVVYVMRANQKLIPTVNEKVKKRNCLFVWFSDQIKYIKVMKYLE